MENRTVTVGLCRGRHPLPVDTYVFDEVTDVTDVSAIENRAYEWVGDNVMYGCTKLRVYVTGLTVCPAAVIQACMSTMVNSYFTIELLHYDRDTGEYFSQTLSGC